MVLNDDKMNYVEKIINTNQTVRTIPELKIFLWIDNFPKISKILQSFKKKWLLFCYYRWIWCRKEYDKLELASKIKSKSYISLQTVLQKEWVIFQDRSNTITLVSDNSVNKQVGAIYIKIHKITKALLTDPIWITNTWIYQIASIERAVCDMLYLDHNFYFDNPNNLDIVKLQDLSKIYNKSTQKSILSLISVIKNGNKNAKYATA